MPDGHDGHEEHGGSDAGSPGAPNGPDGAAGAADADGPNGAEARGAKPEGSILSGDGAKADEPAAPPEAGTYDLKPPPGMSIDAAGLDAFKARAHGLGLNNAQAQKLLDAWHEETSKQLQSMADERGKWADAVRMDKEMGGPRFEATVAEAKAALKKFDPESRVFAMLEETGYSNHPEVIRVLARVGRALGDDTLAEGKAAAEEKPLHERIYGGNAKQ